MDWVRTSWDLLFSSEYWPSDMMPLIKTLNKIASGETDTTAITTQTAKKFIIAQNQRFRTLVARSTMQRRKLKYAKYSEVFLKELGRT